MAIVIQSFQHPLLQGHPVNEIAQGKMMGVLHSLNKHLASASYMALPDSFTLADVAVFVVVSTIHASKVIGLETFLFGSPKKSFLSVSLSSSGPGLDCVPASERVA